MCAKRFGFISTQTLLYEDCDICGCVNQWREWIYSTRSVERTWCFVVNFAVILCRYLSALGMNEILT